MRSEQTFIEALRRRAQIPANSALILGIGDDCAIYRPRGSTEDLLLTSDMIVENVHFVRCSHKPGELGRKALTRSLSDIAAMGGQPRFCLVALCVPRWANSRWAARFMQGILELAQATGTVLAGGDISHGESLVCDVTLIGEVPRGTALRRDGARAGQELYVSGLLGGSALGLEIGKGRAWRRHVGPEARTELGRFIRTTLKATAAIDISDGLSTDLRRLCLASRVDAAITEPPVFKGAGREHALYGGEEYELLFTLDRNRKVPHHFGAIPLSKIGTLTEPRSGTRGGELRLNGRRLPARGYDHFRTLASDRMP